jgi:predicted nucleotidyltransferase
MNFLQTRRETANSRLEQLKEELDKADKLAQYKACVYLTGSYGRGEASHYSDLDLFIVGRGTTNSRELTKLDEILIKAQLIEATRKLEFQDFSGDGEYLKHYTVDDLIETLGTEDDDKTNTFTARLLLLLESRALLEKEVYLELTAKVIDAYWEDYNGHEVEFVPTFLVNDILRLWRTFCVNYEARTKNEKETEYQKANRKLKNYKLKHSRLLTCYSALVYLMGVMEERGTVSKEDAIHMVSLSPIERLQWIPTQPKFKRLYSNVEEIVSLYANFLEKTGDPKEQLIEMFMDKNKSGEAFQGAKEFGNQVYELLSSMGKENKVFRIIVV